MAEENKEKKKTENNDTAKKKKAAPAKSREQKKIKELQEKLKKLETENLELQEQKIRRIAEFENFKRRSEKDFIAHLEYATEDLISELLTVIDNFERFFTHSGEESNTASLVEGAELIYKNLLSILEKKGLKEMELVGQEFDTEKHQALMEAESDKYESGYIVDVHLKGYQINEKVIRHAQVIVSK